MAEAFIQPWMYHGCMDHGCMEYPERGFTHNKCSRQNGYVEAYTSIEFSHIYDHIW